jgi:predicted transcriptional regulator
MPAITIEVDDQLKQRMDAYGDIDWGSISERAIRQRLETLELIDQAAIDAAASDADTAELADRIDEIARRRIERASD